MPLVCVCWKGPPLEGVSATRNRRVALTNSLSCGNVKNNVGRMTHSLMQYFSNRLRLQAAHACMQLRDLLLKALQCVVFGV